MVPVDFQLNPLRLNDSLIYLSNDKFKNIILPYLSSSKHLLKIYLHFRNLYPNVSIEKFLPNSTVKRTVLDLQKTYFAYIFQNEFSFYNPFIFDSEQNCKTITLGCGHKYDDSIYGLFLSTDKIFALESYLLPNNQEIFAILDKTDYSFFVAVASKQTTQEKLTAIAYETIPIWMQGHVIFSDYLYSLWKAHNLNCFTKFYFKIFYLWDKYIKYLGRYRLSLLLYIIEKDNPLRFLSSLKILYNIFRFTFLYLTYFPNYAKISLLLYGA